MIWKILLSALAAAGLIFVCWAIGAAVLLPVKDSGMFMVLLAKGDGRRLEQQCRAYLLLQTVGAIRRPLLLVDGGLDCQGRAVAERLVGDHSEIRLCAGWELLEILHNGA